MAKSQMPHQNHPSLTLTVELSSCGRFVHGSTLSKCLLGQRVQSLLQNSSRAGTASPSAVFPTNPSQLATHHGSSSSACLSCIKHATNDRDQSHSTAARERKVSSHLGRRHTPSFVSAPTWQQNSHTFDLSNDSFTALVS